MMADRFKIAAVLVLAVGMGGNARRPAMTSRALADVPLGDRGNDVTLNGPPLGKNDPAWRTLGMYLQPAGPGAVARANAHFHAGMKVSTVRPNSPAAEAKIQAGDILIGLHQWEIVKGDSVAYVLGFCAREKMKTVRYYVLRKGELCRGDLFIK